MAILQRDQNSITVAGAVDTNDVIKPFLVDPSTGRFLIDLDIVSEPSSPVLNVNKIDQNGHWMAQGVGDDATANEIPLHIDSRNGQLFLDINIE